MTKKTVLRHWMLMVTMCLTTLVVQAATQTLTLTAGWNWIGFNVLPEVPTVRSVLGTTGFVANNLIQTSDNSSLFNGRDWLPDMTLSFEKMYQVYVSKDMTITVTGRASGSRFVSLDAGWNWIANPNRSAVTPSGLSYGSGFCTNDIIQGSDGQVTYGPRGWIPSSGFVLEPGKGYQIYTATGGRLMFPADVDPTLYAVVDLSGGVNASSYPVRYSSTGPDLNDDTCRTTELWLRRIDAGSFLMGSSPNEIGRGQYGEMARHQVTLTKDFYIGVFECTQRQWELVMGTNPSYFKNQSCYAVRPVESMFTSDIRGYGPTSGTNWSDSDLAVEPSSFMGRLQAKTGLNFDLPMEAQWEYACRAGTTTALNSGRNLTSAESDPAMDAVGRYWYNGRLPAGMSAEYCTTDYGTAKVGSYRPNEWGLYDMHGNVMEMCQDWWKTDLDSTEAVTDPMGTEAWNERPFRGGAWEAGINAGWCRSASRMSAGVESCATFMGFRVAILP